MKKFVFSICVEETFSLATIRRSDNGCRHTSCRHCIISDDEIYCC